LPTPAGTSMNKFCASSIQRPAVYAPRIPAFAGMTIQYNRITLLSVVDLKLA